MSRSHREEYQRSLRDPTGCWAEAAEDVHWRRRRDRVIEHGVQALFTPPTALQALGYPR
jgi:hypothetical protein